ncbi:MAG: UDP-glucose dehydrogenase family protein [Bdellovibrionia bacterium]
MQIAVIGTGYVGLVAGACFADTGNTVVCVDRDEAKIEALSQGEIPIFEPGLDTLVNRGVANQRLSFTTSVADALRECEVVFLAVGTPSLPNGEPDLSQLKAACEQVGKSLSQYCLIVNKSTVPIGTHLKTAEWISKHAQHPFDVVSNPEFLKEGSALEDFLKPDRVIVGTHKESVYQKMAELYAPFVRQGNPVIWMDPTSAEITKYACNSFLATRISFMNELANLCDRVGGDVEKVRSGMISDERIGKHFLYAGVGYGGSCFPKDVRALIAKAQSLGLPLGIVSAAAEANERQKQVLVEKVDAYFQNEGGIQGKTFAIWGLAFKPNTDDMREAPSLVVIEQLLQRGAKVQAYDPVAMKTASAILGNQIQYADTALDAVEHADALLILTEWNEFKHPDFDEIRARMKTPLIWDGRNLYSPAQMRQKGFVYFGIGRGRTPSGSQGASQVVSLESLAPGPLL